jgi:hypothetical protein
MNLDDIKDLWHNQDSSATKALQEIPQPGNARGPLERIRKNMKKEFYVQVIAVILIGFFPYHFNFRTELVAPFFALYAVIVAITVYILVKYYFLYRKLSNNTLSSKDHLYALYFDIRLNMEMYKTFVYILVPFVLMSVGMVALNNREGLVISSREIYIIAGSSIVFMLMMAALTNAWVNYFYGKYARQIKALLDDLKEA